MRGRRFRSPRMLDEEPRAFVMPRNFDELFNPNAQPKLGLRYRTVKRTTAPPFNL